MKLHVNRLERQNSRLARTIWGGRVGKAQLARLRALTRQGHFCVAAGDVLLLDQVWYVTHSGLLRLAHRRRCAGITIEVLGEHSHAASQRWAFKATVYKSPKCKGFVGYGDADSSNVSPLVRGAEMRVAETRAVNRALRKAYGIGLCSVDELGARSTPPPKPPTRVTRAIQSQQPDSGNGNGRPLLRDRLCLLIRQYRLDPGQVKRYAADFCGTQILREASRELVEDFINLLAEWAARDRQGLICHLNRYAKGPASAGIKNEEAAS